MNDIIGNNIIGFSESAEGRSFITTVEAATGHELPGKFYLATENEIESIMKLSESAAVALAEVSYRRRAKFLDSVAEGISRLGTDLVDRCRSETGLPEGRIRSELQRTINQLRLFAETVGDGYFLQARINTAIADRQPPRPDIRRMMIPLGPVLVFGASNFPLAFSTAGGDSASAWAAGCPVIVKAHPAHAGTHAQISAAIVEAAKACGMPEGIFSMFYGSREVAMHAVMHEAVKAIGFTGSRDGGMAIYKAATSKRKTPIPVYAEMSSVNPILITPAAILENGEKIARGLADSILLGTGQFCTNPGIILMVDDENSRSFLQKLGDIIEAASPGVMLHAGILSAYKQGREMLKSHPKASWLAGKSEDNPNNANRAVPGLFKVSAPDFLSDRQLQQELFGPSSVVVICKGMEEVDRVINQMEGQLTMSLHVSLSEKDVMGKIIHTMSIKAGRILFGGFPTGVEVCSAQQHGGPFPATTDSRTTSVGTAAVERFLRPVAFQQFPDDWLPEALRERNPLGIFRMENEIWSKDAGA